MKRTFFLFFLISVFTLSAADNVMGDADTAKQLYNPCPWIAVKTLTPSSILHSLRTINKELAETQAKLDHLSDQIPQDKKDVIDALLAKWCTDAQVYMEHVQYESKLEGAEAFMRTYEKQEAVIAAQVTEIERLIQSAQVAENGLGELMGALSLNGQVTDDILIGDLAGLLLGD